MRISDWSSDVCSSDLPPGGGTDMFGRVVAEKLTAEFGWNVVVENKPGAGGSIGVDAAVKAAPDGYTIVLGQTSNMAVNSTLYPNLTYDPLKDLKPVVMVAESSFGLAVRVVSKSKCFEPVCHTYRNNLDRDRKQIM